MIVFNLMLNLLSYTLIQICCALNMLIRLYLNYAYQIWKKFYDDLEIKYKEYKIINSKIENKKIKILMHAYCDENNYNAQDLNAREIAIRLNKKKFDVSLFYVSKPDNRVLKKGNINLLKIPSYKGKFVKFLSLIFLLYHFLKPYDIIFYIRPFKIDNIYLKIKKIMHDKKISVSTVEGVIGDHSRKIAKENILLSNYVYSVSKYVSETVKKYYKINTDVIYVGVDLNIFKPKKNKYVEIRKKIRVLFVGTLSERKRPYLIIKAARNFPNVEFHLIGDGPLRPLLSKLIINLKINNVFLHGRVNIKKLVLSMQMADIFLLPSIIEGFPKVTLEAAAIGIPSIVFANYKPETVVNGETGFIVKTYDEMIERLYLLINNDNLRHRMGQKAREYAQNFHWDTIVKQWEKEFEKMMTRDAIDM